MKVTHRISTGQFEYVEIEGEMPNDAHPSEVRNAHNILKAAFAPQPINSLQTKEWNRFIERVLQGDPNHISEYEKCSPEQKRVVNEVKRALDRLAAAEGRELRDRNNEI